MWHTQPKQVLESLVQANNNTKYTYIRWLHEGFDVHDKFYITRRYLLPQKQCAHPNCFQTPTIA